MHLYNLSGIELYNHAILFKEAADYDNYAIYITMAANYNHKEAIDTIYSNDDHEKQNYALTLKFYEHSIQNLTQNSYSVNYLGYMYDLGLGVEQDYIKAVELYKLAIEKGNRYAMNNLAMSYKFGTGVPQDYNKTMELFELAIENGYRRALLKLASIYIKVMKNYIMAIDLYKKAYENGLLEALPSIIAIYKNTFSFEKDAVISYFNSINQLDKLKDIYTFDDYTISLIKSKYELEAHVTKLEGENAAYKTHIESSPDGIMYLEAKSEWDKLKN